MKKLFLLLLCITLSVSANADIKVQNTVGDEITASYITENAIWMDGIDSIVLGTGFNYPVDTSNIWNPIHVWTEKIDTDNMYISHYDTTLKLIDIECDSAWTTFERNDSTLIKDIIISCDTIYRENIGPVWVDKIKVLLTKEQLDKLMEILK